MSKRLTFYFLTAIFLLALFARVYKLGITPPSVNWDEAALGYNSYSLLKTGSDEYGIHLPLVLRSFDDYKPAMYSYLSIPFIFVFGLTNASVRMISAIAGASLVFSIYFLAKNLARSNTVGLVSSILVVFSPILFLYSRIALEANLALAFFVGGLGLISKRKDFKAFWLGTALLVMSAYSYHSPRYVVPLIFLISLAIYRKEMTMTLKKHLFYLAVFGLSYLPIGYFVLNPTFNTRFAETSIFTNHAFLLGKIANVGTISAIPALLSRGYLYLLDFLGRYLEYFNFYPLFVNATGHSLYRLESLGVFNLAELPFWILGVYVLFKDRKKYHPLLLPSILILGLPASLTVDWFSPLRGILLWPMLLIISSIGFVHGFQRWHKKAKYWLVILFIAGLWVFRSGWALETFFISRSYFGVGDYQYGFSQVIPFIKEKMESNNYDNIIIDSPHAQPHIFFLFYYLYPPELYQKEIQWRVNDHTPRENFNFGPFNFRKIYWPKDRDLKNSLFVGTVLSLPYDQLENSENATILKEFKSPDGNINFRVVETKK